jgi:hypothetical protein
MTGLALNQTRTAERDPGLATGRPPRGDEGGLIGAARVNVRVADNPLIMGTSLV